MSSLHKTRTSFVYFTVHSTRPVNNSRGNTDEVIRSESLTMYPAHHTIS